jgi:hypothetical protein
MLEYGTYAKGNCHLSLKIKEWNNITYNKFAVCLFVLFNYAIKSNLSPTLSETLSLTI